MSILRSTLAPIWLKGSRFLALAASLIRFTITFLITLSIILKSAISLYELTVLQEALPSFLSTIVLTLLRKGRRCLSLRLILVKSISTLATGLLRALRKLNRILLSPSIELKEYPASIAKILSININYSIVKDSLGLRGSSSKRLAQGVRQNLSLSALTFTLQLLAIPCLVLSRGTQEGPPSTPLLQ